MTCHPQCHLWMTCQSWGHPCIQIWHVYPKDMCFTLCFMSSPMLSLQPWGNPCIWGWHVIPDIIQTFGDDMSSPCPSPHLRMRCHSQCHPCIQGWHNIHDVIPKVISIFGDDIIGDTTPRSSPYSGMTCYSWHHPHLLFPFTKQQTTALHKAYWLPCLQLTVIWQNWCQTQISHFVIIWGLIWKCCEWVYWSKLIWEVKLNMICGIPMWKQENIYAGAARGEFLVLLQAQNTVDLINWGFFFKNGKISL